MLKNSIIYLRVLRHVDFSVFCIDTDQKTFYDPITGRSMPYSSGQQIKRSILTELAALTGEERAPVVFKFVAKIENRNKAEALVTEISEREALSKADPLFADQLFGGYMVAPKKDTKTSTKATSKSRSKSKASSNASLFVDTVEDAEVMDHDVEENESKDKDKSASFVIKRRSPLSISCMRPLHPYLATLNNEAAISFDRSDDRNSSARIYDENGLELTPEEFQELIINQQDRSLPLRKFIKDKKRSSGLFVFDVAIDLRRLFSVSTRKIEPEVDLATKQILIDNGWIESYNEFGECLVCPKERRELLIPALAKALLSFTITSNQSRTFSLLETIAVAVSTNPNAVSSSIRGKLVKGNKDVNRAIPVLEAKKDCDLFIADKADGFILDIETSESALEDAEAKLIELMMAYDYEEKK